MRLSNNEAMGAAVVGNAIQVGGSIPPEISPEVLCEYLSAMPAEETFKDNGTHLSVVDNSSGGLYPIGAYVVFDMQSFNMVNEGGFFAIWGEFVNLGDRTPQSEKYVEYLKKKVLDGCYMIDISVVDEFDAGVGLGNINMFKINKVVDGICIVITERKPTHNTHETPRRKF